MVLLSNYFYKSDVKESLSTIVNVADLKEKSILITGGSGLIGSSIVDQLLLLNDLRNFNIKIYCCGRNLSYLKERFGAETSFLKFVAYDAAVIPDFDFDIDFIIHAASPASPELYVNQPVETMTSNFLGMYNLLSYAKNAGVSKVLYVSSSEVYGLSSSDQPLEENYIGLVDHLNVRSSYANSKRATETLCESFVSEYALNITIVRPGHIYGPSAKVTDNRVSSFFMNEAIAGRDIVMKSTGSQLRSYCYSLDCASAILSVLLSGKSGQAYNISNPNSIITIKQMAEIIARVGNVKLIMDIPSKQDLKQANPMQNASLKSDKIESLGWKGLFDAKVGFGNTYRILKEFTSANK
ncbi:NAD-dependent epimerase/dehydratase family protein [Streptococcus sinensis]|uniref:dTDP-glucose 4,6-dehydratase n=1 Tax=Streptococcus sinensis TaxID=176090 RepID=A0A0A0DE25_9STRE|nr:NAD-dependent epimerase/dehydratase family protein [Streptococcus sinensis]KGM36334.1 dTDP-glucose 4,6-dehydratase [Streptococcus sinensis]